VQQLQAVEGPAGAAMAITMIISTTTRRVFVAPTSGRARLTKAAAYREEARARFAATCDCAEIGEVCSYHDAARWRPDPLGYSANGRVIARWASLLAALDGVTLGPPLPTWRPSTEPAPDDDLPF
jgi:hypothetical protein